MMHEFTNLARFGTKIVFIMALMFSSLFLHAQGQSTGELHGKVCDESGKPIASATVTLSAENQGKQFHARTGADGNFSLSGLPSGNYSLTFAASGFADSRFSSISITSEARTFDVALQAVNPQSSPGSNAPQFFDQPQFTVSGVTDTSDMGGHGSGPITRSREAVEKDVTSLSFGPLPSPQTSSTPYDLALKYANTHEYARARDQLRNLLARHPTAEAHHLLAAVDEGLGDSLEAVHEYQRAAELDPSESNTFDWGSELLLHHAPEPAIEVFTTGTRLFPDSSRMLIGLGAGEFAAGSNERAIQELCRASDLHPGDPVPYLFLGKIQRSENTVPAEVVERFHRFLTLQPESADANYLYAVALWRQSQPSPSDTALSKIELLLKVALRLNPKFADAYLQLGILEVRKQTSAAIVDFQRAVESQPNLEEAHYRLAQAYRATGRIEDAKMEVAAYQHLREQSLEETEREHHEIKQFVYDLRSKPATQTP